MKEKEKGNRALKVVIVGNGKVGFSLAEQLVKEKYDVTIVDMREESLRRASDALDIMSVKGNGVSVSTLEDAGAADAGSGDTSGADGEKAEASPRRRMHYDLRTSSGDTSQRMLNVLMKDTVIPVHRHNDTSETVIECIILVSAWRTAA